VLGVSNLPISGSGTAAPVPAPASELPWLLLALTSVVLASAAWGMRRRAR
jgi:hypothetical protein